MANKYWVGGTGTWSTLTANWSLTSGGPGGAAIPNTNDAAIFNASSGGTYTVTLSGSPTCNSLTVSAGTVTFGGAGSTLSITGGFLSLTNNTVWTSTGNITIAGNQYVTCGTVVLNCLQFIINTGAGVQILLGSNLNLSANSRLFLTQGILFLNGFNLYAGGFSSSGALTRQLQFNSAGTATGGVYLAPANNSFSVIDVANAFGFTWSSPGNSLAGFNVTTTAVGGAMVFSFGSSGGTQSSANAINLYISAGTGTITMGNNSWWNIVNFTGNTSTVSSAATLIGTALTLAAGGTYTSFTFTFNRVNSTFTTNGKTVAAFTVNSAGNTVTLVGAATTILTAVGSVTLTAGTLNLAGYTVTTGAFISTGSLTRALQFGGATIFVNSSVSGTAVLNMSNLTGFTYTGTPNFSTSASVTRVFTCGVTGSTRDNAPNLYITSGTGLTTGSITNNSYFNILDFTGSAGAPSGSVSIATSLTLASGGTYSGLAPTFNGFTGTFTTQGKTVSSFTVNHTINNASVTTLLGALQTGNATLIVGSLDLAGYTLTCTATFSTNSIQVRSLLFGTSTIFLTATGAAFTVLSMANLTNFTLTGTGGFSCTMSNTKTFTCGNTAGATTTNVPNLSLTAGGSAPTFTTGSFFGILNFTGSTGTPVTTALNVNSLTLAAGGTYTGLTINARGTGTITGNGKTIAALTINNPGLTVSLGSAITCSGIGTLTAGTLALVSYTLTVLTFNSSNSNTRAIQFGTGTILLSQTAINTTLWETSTTTNFTTTTSGGGVRSTYSSNSGSRTVNPGSLSEANAINFTLNGTFTGGTIIGAGTVKNLVFIYTTGPSISNTLTATTLTIYGSAQDWPPFVTATSFTFGSTSGTKTIEFVLNVPTIGADVIFNGVGGTWQLNTALTLAAAKTATLTAGTLALNAQTLTTEFFNTSGTGVRSITFGAGTLTASGTGTAFDATTATNLTTTGTGTINLTSASSKTFAGGGASYPTLNQGGAGTLTITGSSTFANITNTVQPATVLFTAGTTSTFTLFSLTGTAGNLITIGSPTSAQHTLSKASGTVTVDYLSISYSNATGGATWDPGANSIDGGNNSGWVFAAIAANSNFFLLF